MVIWQTFLLKNYQTFHLMDYSQTQTETQPEAFRMHGLTAFLPCTVTGSVQGTGLAQ